MTYDPRVVFDDVLGDDHYVVGKEKVDIIDMAGVVLRKHAGRRLGALPQRVEKAHYDTTDYTFASSNYYLGADEGVDEGEHPLYDQIRARFRSAVGKPKLVRLDDEESYQDFRARRRQPHIDELDARLTRLEKALHEHVSDAHGGFGDDVRAFESYLDNTSGRSDDHERAIVGAVADAARGGTKVPLGLPPSARGKIECWRDGDEVLLSAKLPIGIATTGAALVPEIEEIVGCANEVGCCGLEALLLGWQLAPSTAGKRLLGDLCRAAPLLGHAPGIRVLQTNVDAGLAAMMALLQRCQRGDRQACREASEMLHGGQGCFVREAGERLTHAQREKARALT